MSLFENPEYQWRETYFVLFDSANIPTLKSMQSEAERLGERLKVSAIRGTEDGAFESMTLMAPDDFSAMDIVVVAGDEVAEQLPELIEELESNAIDEEEKSKVKKVAQSTARLDIFHFEQQSFAALDGEEPDFMDPGGVIVVLDRLAELCKGIVVDPQSSSVM